MSSAPVILKKLFLKNTLFGIPAFVLLDGRRKCQCVMLPISPAASPRCFGVKVVYICTEFGMIHTACPDGSAKIASVILPVTSSYIMWHSCLSALCSEYRGVLLRIRGATDTLLSVYVSMRLSFLFPKATNGSRPVSAVDSKPGTAQAFLRHFFISPTS